MEAAVAVGGSDVRCTRACNHLPTGTWPCDEDRFCTCNPGAPAPTQEPTLTPTTAPLTSAPPTQAPAPESTLAPTMAPSPMPTTSLATATTVAAQVCLHQKDCAISAWCTQDGYEAYCHNSGALNHCPTPVCKWVSTTQATTTTVAAQVCLHQKDCAISAWCDQDGYEAYCRDTGALHQCPTPVCKWGFEEVGLLDTHGASKGDCATHGCAETMGSNLLQMQTQHQSAIVLTEIQAEVEAECISLDNAVVNDTVCAATCGALPGGWWPCGEGGPCACTVPCAICKSRCQDLCNNLHGGVQTSQCWGAERYIECTCKDNSRHSFDGCPCEHSQCP